MKILMPKIEFSTPLHTKKCIRYKNHTINSKVTALDIPQFQG